MVCKENKGNGRYGDCKLFNIMSVIYDFKYFIKVDFRVIRLN